MNILVIIQRVFAGCGFYRLYQPYNHLAKNYGVKVTLASSLMKSNISAYTDDELREFDAVVWHKTLFDIRDVRRVRDLGIVTIADFDDHWVVNREHSLYKQYVSEGLPVRLHKLLMTAEYITCTTEELADAIMPINSNVEVLPNAIDPNYDGWKNTERVKENTYVFGYLGGPCHVRDLGLLKGLQKQMTDTLKGYQFRLFGYNGTDIYNHYANILSDDKQSPNYTIYKGADIWNYPQFYNHMDCSLVPLENNSFNRYKSELKMIEAGYFKKACIVSNVRPYTGLIRHGKNCLAANTRDDWYRAAKLLLENRNLSIDLGEQLHEDTQKYHITEVNEKRFKFLEQCTTRVQLSQLATTS